MDVQLTNQLQLVFFNSVGGSNTLSPKFFKEELASDAVKLQDWMTRFSALGLFRDAATGAELYTEKKSARLVETKVTQLF